jgi:hypothetical protein
VESKASKRFFFEKKKQKTFVTWTVPVKPPMAQSNKSFLVTFFQKSNGLLHQSASSS